MQLLERYEKRDYEPLLPEAVDPSQILFKFNSPQHFISYIQALDELNNSRQSRRTSSTDTDSSTSRFTLSECLPQAYQLIRETKFDPTKTDILQAKISELRRGTFFSEEGYEIDIPEFLSGGDRTWIKDRSKRTPTRLISDTLVIDVAYTAGRDAEKCKRIGIELITEIYRRNVIPRKLVLVFDVIKVKGDADDTFLYSIDVDFRDLNGVAKMMHPSAFRRLWFRLVEIYPDLAYGYGTNPRRDITKGYISFESVYDRWEEEGYKEKQVDVFLGLQDTKEK